MSNSCIAQTTSSLTPTVVVETEAEKVAKKTEELTAHFDALETSTTDPTTGITTSIFDNFSLTNEPTNPHAGFDFGGDTDTGTNPFANFGGGASAFNFFGRML